MADGVQPLCVFCERRPVRFVLSRRGVESFAGVCDGCRMSLQDLVELFGTDLRAWVVFPVEFTHVSVLTLEEEERAAVCFAEEFLHEAQRGG